MPIAHHGGAQSGRAPPCMTRLQNPATLKGSHKKKDVAWLGGIPMTGKDATHVEYCLDFLGGSSNWDPKREIFER